MQAGVGDVARFRDHHIGRIERADSIDALYLAGIGVVIGGDADNIVLRLFVRRDATVFLHRTGAGVIGGERQRHGAEGAQLLQQIARAAIELQHRVIVVFWIDPEIFGGAGNDLGEAERCRRTARADGKPALLFDQTLKPTAKLHRIDPGAHQSRVTAIAFGGLDDHLLDGHPCITKEPPGIGVVVVDRIGLGGRKTATHAFQISDEGRRAGQHGKRLLQGRDLLFVETAHLIALEILRFQLGAQRGFLAELATLQNDRFAVDNRHTLRTCDRRSDDQHQN